MKKILALAALCAATNISAMELLQGTISQTPGGIKRVRSLSGNHVYGISDTTGIEIGQQVKFTVAEGTIATVEEIVAPTATVQSTTGSVSQEQELAAVLGAMTLAEPNTPEPVTNEEEEAHLAIAILNSQGTTTTETTPSPVAPTKALNTFKVSDRTNGLGLGTTLDQLKLKYPDVDFSAFDVSTFAANNQGASVNWGTCNNDDALHILVNKRGSPTEAAQQGMIGYLQTHHGVLGSNRDEQGRTINLLGYDKATVIPNEAQKVGNVVKSLGKFKF